MTKQIKQRCNRASETETHQLLRLAPSLSPVPTPHQRTISKLATRDMTNFPIFRKT